MSTDDGAPAGGDSAESAPGATASSGGDVTAGAEAGFEALRYAISHDLSAPVRHVVAFSKMLDQRVGEQLDGTDAELLKRLTGAATRLDQMLTGMIEHARMLKRSAERAPVDLDTKIDSVVKRIVLGVDRDPVPEGTTVTLDATAGPAVVTDVDLVEIIVTELLANAIEAADPDRPNVVEVRLRHADGALVIEVADTGTGMNTEHLDRAVKLFGRLVTASQRPGTGVGLTLAQDAVDLLGGTLTHTPVEPHGSIFTVNLPD